MYPNLFMIPKQDSNMLGFSDNFSEDVLKFEK